MLYRNRLQLLISDRERDALHEAAAKLDWSVSQLVRHYIFSGLRADGVETDPAGEPSRLALSRRPLRAEIEATGISMAELGRRVNVTPQTVQAWCKRGVPQWRCEMIDQALGLTSRIDDSIDDQRWSAGNTP